MGGGSERFGQQLTAWVAEGELVGEDAAIEACEGDSDAGC